MCFWSVAVIEIIKLSPLVFLQLIGKCDKVQPIRCNSEEKKKDIVTILDFKFRHKK